MSKFTEFAEYYKLEDPFPGSLRYAVVAGVLEIEKEKRKEREEVIINKIE